MVNGISGWGGYYLSAYGIAVKHGYVGTEEEWLDYLKANVEMRYENGVLEWCNRGEEDWHTLDDFTELQKDIVAKANAAKQAADIANMAAQNADVKAQAAQEAATAANTAATAANNATTAANSAAASATAEAQNAKTQADYAKAEADRADELLGKIENTEVGGMAADILELQESLDLHTSDSVRHITNTERNKWNMLPSSVEFSVAASAWSQASGNYAYTCSVYVSGLTANDVVNVSFDINSYVIANDAGVSGITDTSAGKFSLYADAQPTETLTGNYFVIKGGV